MSQEIIIKAGQQTRADLVYDEQPGAEVLDNTRLLLQYDPNKIIYLNTATGNDSNSGFTSALAKLTYAAAAATIGGARDTVQVENDGAVIDVPVTVPTQVKLGVSAKINMIAPYQNYNGVATNRATGYGDKSYFYRDEITGRLGITSNSPGLYLYSDDDGVTWNTTTFSTPYTDYTFFSPYDKDLAGFLTVLDAQGYTLAKINAAQAQVSQTTILIGDSDPAVWNISGIQYDAKLKQRVGLKGGTTRYFAVSTNYPAMDVWTKLFDSAFTAPNTILDFLIFDDYYLIVHNSGAGIDIATKYDADSDFIIRAANVPFHPTNGLSKKLNGTAYFCSDKNVLGWALFVDGVYMPKTANPPKATDAVYDEATDLIYVVGDDNLTNSPSAIKIYVYDTNGNFLYSWVVLGGTGFMNAIAITPTQLLITTVNHAFPAFGITSVALSSTKQIKNNVAGFSILDGKFDVTAAKIYSCSKKILDATANEIIRCKTASFTNTVDTARIEKNLCFGDMKNTASPAAQDDVKIISNTIVGKITIINTAATNRESIKDNIIEGGITATFPVTVLSGNTRGANINVIFSSACFFNDPQFIDLIDYKLKYKSQGFTADSPLIRKSLTFKNSIGERRNLGAYSAYETNKTFIYDRAFSFLKPSRDGLKIKKNTQANLIVSIDGTPDVATNPDGQWEELLLSYGSLPNSDVNDAIKNHIAFIDYLDTLLNTACEIIVDPDYAPATSAIVNGAHAIGAIVLALDPSNILAGDRLQIGADIYFVLYKSGDSVVLHTPLKTAVADNQVLPVFASAPGGIYQYVPEAPRQLSRWQSDRTDFLRGASLRFVRKWV